MAQLSTRSNHEDPGSNPFIDNNNLLLTVCRKDEIKKNEAGDGPTKSISFKIITRERHTEPRNEKTEKVS